MRPSRVERGFTLMELMIIVAVIGILVAVAFPSYRDAVLKGRRAEGRAAIMRTMQAEERFYTGNNSYLAFASSASNLPNGFATHSSDDPAKSAYLIGAAACTASTIQQCVEITAVSSQTDPLCGKLIMDSTGNKSSKSSADAATTGCW